MSATTDHDTDLHQLHDLAPRCDRRHPHQPEPATWSTLWAPAVRACALPVLLCDHHADELRKFIRIGAWITCAHGHFPRTKFRDAVLSLDPLQ